MEEEWRWLLYQTPLKWHHSCVCCSIYTQMRSEWYGCVVCSVYNVCISLLVCVYVLCIHACVCEELNIPKINEMNDSIHLLHVSLCQQELLDMYVR